MNVSKENTDFECLSTQTVCLQAHEALVQFTSRPILMIGPKGVVQCDANGRSYCCASLYCPPPGAKVFEALTRSYCGSWSSPSNHSFVGIGQAPKTEEHGQDSRLVSFKNELRNTVVVRANSV